MVNYRKRLVEVDEILSQMSETDIMKIPQDIRNAIKQAKDAKYVWKYDTAKSLSEQGLSIDTITLLSYLNTEFMLDAEQRKLMLEIYKLNDYKRRMSSYKAQKANDSAKLNQNILTSIVDDEKIKNDEVTSLIPQLTKSSLFRKLINRLKSMFS